MPDADTVELTFTSVYRHKVDEKRRVPIPYRWRPKTSVEYTLMLFLEQDIGNYLRVLPPAQWLKLLEEIKGMPSDHEQKPILQRIVGRDSTEVKLDSAGRLMIPDIMAEAADIKGEAVLAGNLGHFELWSPTRHALLEEKDKAERLNVLKRVRAL
ncbi:MAG TPA: hypothetical protein VH595_09760 [Verrucomicrobiae bacterium]|jgi:MraZ protein|nr:hypothetical protein [Verrucomicrobiae bacterium]